MKKLMLILVVVFLVALTVKADVWNIADSNFWQITPEGYICIDVNGLNEPNLMSVLMSRTAKALPRKATIKNRIFSWPTDYNQAGQYRITWVTTQRNTYDDGTIKNIVSEANSFITVIPVPRPSFFRPLFDMVIREGRRLSFYLENVVSADTLDPDVFDANFT
jgi:hypothetical protein